MKPPPKSYKVPVAKAKSSATSHAHNPLDGVAAIVLILDNGTEYTLDVGKETYIPDDLDEVREAAKLAPGRLAFIGGQMERSLYVVRVAETNLAATEGGYNETCREALEDEREGELVAESAVNAMVSREEKVVAARLKVHELRLHYGLLRSLHDAASHRVWIMNRLLDQVAKSHST